MTEDVPIPELSAEEQKRRYELTLEALKDVDEGRVLSHEEALARFDAVKRARRAAYEADH